MNHNWKLIETTKEFYYGGQNKDGSYNKTPVTIEECDLCHTRKEGPFGEQGCWYYHEFYDKHNNHVYPEPICLELNKNRG